jgi:RimJ/RimL family protein N-acetyltransferase
MHMTALADIRPTVLHGRLVTLEPMEEGHAAALFKIGKEETIWTHMARGPLVSEADARELIRAALREQDARREVPFVIRLRATKAVVGSTRYLDIQPAHGSVEIGWTFLHPSHWSTSAAAESEFLLAGHAIEVLGATRVWFKADGRNLRAQRALERWGVVREGVLRRHMRVRDNFIRDSVIYSILPEEWPALKARVVAALSALWAEA